MPAERGARAVLGDERLLERLGYRRAGVVPDYAEKSGGGFEPTVIFYKKLL